MQCLWFKTDKPMGAAVLDTQPLLRRKESMSVAKLHRASDDATWLLQVGDENDTPEKVQNKALAVANGDGDTMPGNGDPSWAFVEIVPDAELPNNFPAADTT